MFDVMIHKMVPTLFSIFLMLGLIGLRSDFNSASPQQKNTSANKNAHTAQRKRIQGSRGKQSKQISKGILNKENDEALLSVNQKAVEAKSFCVSAELATSRAKQLSIDLGTREMSQLDRAQVRSRYNDAIAEAAKYDKYCDDSRRNVDKQALALMITRNWDRTILGRVVEIYDANNIDLLDSFADALSNDGWQEFSTPNGRIVAELPGQPLAVHDDFVSEYKINKPYLRLKISVSKPIEFSTPLTEKEAYEYLYKQSKSHLSRVWQNYISYFRPASKAPIEGYPGIEYGADLPENSIVIYRLYIIENRIYDVSALSYIGRHPSFSKFLNSLRLKKSF